MYVAFVTGIYLTMNRDKNSSSLYQAMHLQNGKVRVWIWITWPLILKKTSFYSPTAFICFLSFLAYVIMILWKIYTSFYPTPYEFNAYIQINSYEISPFYLTSKLKQINGECESWGHFYQSDGHIVYFPGDFILRAECPKHIWLGEKSIKCSCLIVSRPFLKCVPCQVWAFKATVCSLRDCFLKRPDFVCRTLFS